MNLAFFDALMIEEKLNLAFIRQYKTVFSEQLMIEPFREKKMLTGKEILHISPIKQLNLLIIKSLFEKWQEEIKRIESPYFNYQAPKVKIVISQLMNILSQNISINTENLKPIIEKAVEDLIMLNFDPANYLNNEIKERPEILTNKKFNSQFMKYIIFHKPLILEFIEAFDSNNLNHLKNYATDFFEVQSLDNHQLIEQLSETLIVKKQELFQSSEPVKKNNESNVTVKEPSKRNEYEDDSPLDSFKGQSVPKGSDNLLEENKEKNSSVTESVDAHEKNKDAQVEKNLEIETKKNRVNIEKETIPSKGKNNSPINQQNDKEKVTKIDTDDLTQERSVEESIDLEKIPLPNESSLETNNDLSMNDFQTLDEIKTNNWKKDELNDFPLEDPIIEVYKSKKDSSNPSKALIDDLGYRKEPELSKLEFETINEQFQSKSKTIADTHQEERITSILSNISINHQYMFVKELFEDSEDKFKATIKSIERLENFDAAVEYLITNEAKKYQWDMNAVVVKELLKIIFRRFR